MIGDDSFIGETFSKLSKEAERKAMRHLLNIWGYVFLRFLLSSLLLLWAVNSLFNLGIPLTGENIIGGGILLMILRQSGTSSHAK